MKPHLLRSLMLVVALAAAAVGAHAQVQNLDWERCTNQGTRYEADSQIASCTTIIQSGKETTENLGIAHGNRGLAWRRKGDNAKAVADYDEAIRLKPDSVSSYNGRGNILNERKQHDRAIADFDEAARLSPSTAIIFNNRGNAFADKGDKERALRDYDRAIELNPQYANAFNGRGATYFELRQYDRAIADFDAALRINPQHPDATVNRKRAVDAKGR